MGKVLIAIIVVAAVVAAAQLLAPHLGIRPSPEIKVTVPDVNF